MDDPAAQSLLRFAEEVGEGLRGLDAKAAFAELEQRYDELLAALDWFIDEQRTDEALRLATALTPFWTATKRVAEGTASFDRVLGLPGGEDPHRGRASFDAGMLAFWEGDDQRSSELHDRALELGLEAKDPTVASLALGGLARVALRADDLDKARSLCREALAVSEGTDDRAGRSGALHVLGVAAQMAGDLAEARDLMSERLALMRELENYAGISSEAGNLSMVERQLGNLDGADALAREALEIDYRRGDDLPMPWKLNGLAAVAAERAEHERAATMIGSADAMIEAQGASWPPDEIVHYERTVSTVSEALGADAFEQARAAGRAMTSREAVDFALGS